MKKLIVHCGMPKTGTSISQYFFNRLSGEGVINYFPAFKKGIAHHQLANDIIHQNAVGFLDETNEISKPLNLISSENFSNGFGKKIDGIRSFYKQASPYLSMEFIVVLRRMDSFLDSMYCQQVRFGKYSGDISDYVSSRKKWLENFFNGIGQAKLLMGEDLSLPAYGRGFNVIDFFSDRLKVEKAHASRILEGAPNTAKFSYKSQVVLNYLERFNSEYGVTITRKDMVRVLSSGELQLNGDSFDYTFIDPSKAEGILNASLSYAKKYSVHEYLDNFSGIKKDNLGSNVLPMRFDVITDEDADSIISLWGKV